jgi:hypothetical protein
MRSLLLLLSFGALACSAVIQSIQAQSTDASQTSVVLTKLAQLSYPPAARQARIQRNVQIMVGVRRDGSVESVSLTSGYAILARAALQSAQNSEYRCQRCSDSVTSCSLIYTFRLEDPAPGQSREEPITQLANHVTVTDESPTVTTVNTDPPSTFVRRSAKCLYLWKCGLR